MNPQPKKRSTSTFDLQRKECDFKSKAGVNISYASSRGPNKCSNAKRDKAFTHVYERRRQPQKTIDCPRSPGQEEEQGQDERKGGGGPPEKLRHM